MSIGRKYVNIGLGFSTTAQAMTTVRSLAGDVLLSSDEPLTEEQVVSRLSAIMNAEHVQLLPGDTGEFTAVATVDLWMRSLGVTADSEDLEAFKAEAHRACRDIVACACSHGGPGHLEGYLRVKWRSPLAPPAAFGKKGMVIINHSVDIIPKGVLVKVTKAPDTLGEVQEWQKILEEPMRLKDFLDLRRDAPMSRPERVELLSRPEGAGFDEVHRMVRLKHFGQNEVELELYHKYWSEEDNY